MKEVERRDMGVYTIAKLQKITPRLAREIPRKYKGKEIILKKLLQMVYGLITKQ